MPLYHTEDQAMLAESVTGFMADEGGMCAIWTGEHHGMSFTIAPNPLLNLVDLARRTIQADAPREQCLALQVNLAPLKTVQADTGQVRRSFGRAAEDQQIAL